MPHYCNNCIHKKVCKYVDKVQEWEDRTLPPVLGSNKIIAPINVNCDAKITFEQIDKLR